MLKVGAIDLFCGIGGLTRGLHDSGIKVVAGIDLDPTCRYSYEINNGSRFIHKNICEINGELVRTLLSDYDLKVLVGCAPCQPFSSYQKHKKDRSTHKDWSLLYQFSRIIEESRPSVVSMENVPAIVKEKIFSDFIQSLKDMNYWVSYDIVNAADYGVAQSRKRLILLASRHKLIEIIKPTHSDNWRNVFSSIGHLEPVKAGAHNKLDPLHKSSRLTRINLERIKASKPNGTWRDWPEDLLLACHKRPSGNTYSSVYGRMSWSNVSPTITTQFTSYGTGRFGHPDQDRALSLREGALLQSFPGDYRFVEDGAKISIKTLSRHIGNALPPKLGEAIGRSIILGLGGALP